MLVSRLSSTIYTKLTHTIINVPNKLQPISRFLSPFFFFIWNVVPLTRRLLWRLQRWLWQRRWSTWWPSRGQRQLDIDSNLPSYVVARCVLCLCSFSYLPICIYMPASYYCCPQFLPPFLCYSPADYIEFCFGYNTTQHFFQNLSSSKFRLAFQL